MHFACHLNIPKPELSAVTVPLAEPHSLQQSQGMLLYRNFRISVCQESLGKPAASLRSSRVGCLNWFQGRKSSVGISVSREVSVGIGSVNAWNLHSDPFLYSGASLPQNYQGLCAFKNPTGCLFAFLCAWLH